MSLSLSFLLALTGAVSARGPVVHRVQQSLHSQETAVGHGVSLVIKSSAPLPKVTHSRTETTLDFVDQLPEKGSGPGAVWRLRHNIQSPTSIWLPHVSPYGDTVIGDHSLRSPVVLLADGGRVMALVIDKDDIEAAHRHGWMVWLDYDHPAHTVSVAAGAYKVDKFHVAYVPTDVQYTGQKARVRVHVLTSDSPEDLANPYGFASRELWRRWGRSGYLKGGSQRATFLTYSGHVANWAFAHEPKGWGDTVWQEFTVDGRPCGAPAFIVDVAQHPSVPMDQRKWREQRSVWNQAWFSNQRTANGLLRYARRTGSGDLERRAKLMTNLALAAPQTDGLFPAVYTTGNGQWYQLYKDTVGWDKARWTNSDRRPPGVSEKAVHILDAAFTARLLLEWADMNPGSADADTYVAKFADRLCKLQAADGSFPGWVEPDGSVCPVLRAGPESAMGASLLIDLVRRHPDRDDYRQAARRALDYLADGPVKESRWEDFETYFSCSRWGDDLIGKRIARNGVYKSNTLSIFWCAEAFLKADEVFGQGKYLALGRRCLDELSLYQQVWEPSNIPAPTHGGFGVMNADGEWDDARQSLFAPLYLDYYRRTGHPEYFERGVSALRASFAMMYCPENKEVKAAYEAKYPFFGPESYGFMMENIAHGGPGPAVDQIGPFNIYSWGNGAALAAAATVFDGYGDAYVDVSRREAFGIDGLTAQVDGDEVVLSDRYDRAEAVVVSSTGKRNKVTLTDHKGRVSLARLK
ncbi:MAG: hypothetical protein KF857_05610 [Fimbriimonadaceae bacterium]|nr:hypothetical protein [Fimbriimonadaceae bacterium]